MKGPAVVLLLLAACGHSEPFVTADQEIAGPFTAGEPLRLTYSPLTDVGIGISADGQWLTYQFERGTPDRDRCVAILPVAGGQRQAELCPWGLEEVSEANGLANAALRSDGMIAFSLHTGLINNMTSSAAGLYLAPSDSVAGATQILRLLERPNGASATWGDLVDPVWTADDELMALAASRFLANTSPCGTCPPPRDSDRTAYRDTVSLGVEIVRLAVTPSGASVRSTIPAFEAIAWSHDASNGSVHYIVQRAAPDDVDIRHESVADTLMRTSTTGGVVVPLYGVPVAGSGRVLERLHGVASGHGRVFLSRSWRDQADAPFPTVPPGAELHSDIVEVMPDGTLRVIAPAVTWHWNKIRMSPDGRFLYAEGLERGGGNLYRITLP